MFGVGFNQPQSIKAGHIAQTLASKYLNSEISENLQDGHFFSFLFVQLFFFPFICFIFVRFIILTLVATYRVGRNTVTEKGSRLDSQLASYWNIERWRAPLRELPCFDAAFPCVWHLRISDSTVFTVMSSIELFPLFCPPPPSLCYNKFQRYLNAHHEKAPKDSLRSKVIVEFWGIY